MTPDETRKMIKRHEGYLEKVYKDSLGNLTCGYGHYLAEGSEVPRDVSDAFFTDDMIRAHIGYCILKLDLDPVRKAVIIDMLFNLGLSGVQKFVKMLAAIKEEHYVLAAEEMRNSLWAKQVGTRATELSSMMRTGK